MKRKTPGSLAVVTCGSVLKPIKLRCADDGTHTQTQTHPTIQPKIFLLVRPFSALSDLVRPSPVSTDLVRPGPTLSNLVLAISTQPSPGQSVRQVGQVRTRPNILVVVLVRRTYNYFYQAIQKFVKAIIMIMKSYPILFFIFIRMFHTVIL